VELNIIIVEKCFILILTQTNTIFKLHYGSLEEGNMLELKPLACTPQNAEECIYYNNREFYDITIESMFMGAEVEDINMMNATNGCTLIPSQNSDFLDPITEN
jgi:hypothetical protein